MSLMIPKDREGLVGVVVGLAAVVVLGYCKGAAHAALLLWCGVLCCCCEDG